MSLPLQAPNSDTVEVAVARPYRVDDMGCIHVTISGVGSADIGAWITYLNGPGGQFLDVEAVDPCVANCPSITSISEIIAQHGASLADAIETDAELTRFRADVAQNNAD